MRLQRAVGIMIILGITLFIIPNLHKHFKSEMVPTLTKVTSNRQDFTTISVEKNQLKTTDGYNDKDVTEYAGSMLVETKDISSTVATNSTTPKPLTSYILDDVSMQSLDIIGSLTMPDLPAKPKLRDTKSKPIIFAKNGEGVWTVRIASLKASEPFAISGFKQTLAKNKIKYTVYNHIINKTKWVRFNTPPLKDKQSAINLRNHINRLLKTYQVKASLIKNK